MKTNTHLNLFLILIVLVTFMAVEPGWEAAAAVSWYVAISGSDANSCTSPAAPCQTINGAYNKAAAGDTIYLSAEAYTEGYPESSLTISKSITISGGWNAAFDAQVGYTTMNGSSSRRVIMVADHINVNLDHLILQNGSAVQCGGIDLRRFSDGNPSSGKIHLDHLVIRNNSANYNGGGLCNWRGETEIEHTSIDNNRVFEWGNVLGGGGIFLSNGKLTIRDSSITNNKSDATSGGGIGTESGKAILENVTLSGNTARAGSGGGIYVWSGATFDLFNTTIVQNSASDGGGIGGYPDKVHLRNSLLAENKAVNLDTGLDSPSNCSTTLVSAGYNLVADLTGCTITPAVGDQFGVAKPGLGAVESWPNPGLSPAYIPLLPGSPAVNAGNPAGCSGYTGTLLDEDEREKERFGRCDIGAYELQPLEYSTKTASVRAAYYGERVDFTITLKNPAAVAYSAVTLTDALPGGLIYVSGSVTATSGFAYYNGVINWEGSIPAGGSVTIQFGTTVVSQVPLGTTVTNTAVISHSSEQFWKSASLLIDYHRVLIPRVDKPCRPIFKDDFSNSGSGWPVSSDADGIFNYVNGEYVLGIYQKDIYFLASPGLSFANSSAYTISVDVRSPTAGSKYATYGILLLWNPDLDYFFEFEIGPDGYYGLFTNNGIEWGLIREGTSTAIKQGSAVNRIRIVFTNKQLSLYANDQLLTAPIDLTSYLPDPYQGSVGLIAFSYDQPYVEAWFDNYLVYDLACNPYGISSAGNRNQNKPAVAPLRSLHFTGRR